MKKISNENYYQITPKDRFPTLSEISPAIRHMEIGEALQFSDDEWCYKTDVPSFVSNFIRRYQWRYPNLPRRKYECRRLNDKSGWGIIRLE